MSRARTILGRVVRAADDDGFGAHAAHVLVGDESAVHHWSPDVRRPPRRRRAGVALVPGLVARGGVEVVTLRHLLSMRSGIDLEWSETMMTDWPDLARDFLSRPPAGRVFGYSDASTYTAMRAVAVAIDDDVHAWLEPRLFGPLGIDDPPWDRCPHGAVLAGAGLHLTVGELARVGQLIRDGGVWQGRRLVSARWPEAMATNWQIHDSAPDYGRYSLAGWGGPGDAWRLHGAYGQLVVFRGDAVVTLTADDHDGADRMAHRVVEVLSA